MEDYERVFEEFWREIVCNPDGTFNADAVKRELHDYHTMLDETPKVYDHVTGGRITKPNTHAMHVTQAADEHYEWLFGDDAT